MCSWTFSAVCLPKFEGLPAQFVFLLRQQVSAEIVKLMGFRPASEPNLPQNAIISWKQRQSLASFDREGGGVMRQANEDVFYAMPEWLVAFLFLGLMAAACEIGFRRGLRSRASERTKALVFTVAGSILGLLALLLGFTMSMAVSRYDARRRLVVDEANAIRTAYLRMQAVPAPESKALEEVLREYAENRLRVSQSTLDTQKLQKGKEEDARLQSELWSRAAALSRKDPQSVPAGILMESLNSAFDLENSRWIGFVAHLPLAVIYVNGLMGLIAALMVGYDFGMTGHRHPLSEALLIFSITVVIAVIVELDRPYSGVIRVSQQPLVDLQPRLAAPSH